jgi:hypothetical protein
MPQKVVIWSEVGVRQGEGWENCLGLKHLCKKKRMQVQNNTYNYLQLYEVKRGVRKKIISEKSSPG